MIQGSVYARELTDGTYRLETDKATGSRKEKLLLDGARDMCLSEDTVSESGKVATLRVSDGGDVKEFERKYPWHDEKTEEETTEIREGKLLEGVDTNRCDVRYVDTVFWGDATNF